MNELEAYIDGACKGNPGTAGIGVVFLRDKKVVKKISCYIGQTTNNVAEYTALIFALQEALILGCEKLRVNTDSQLLCRQIKRLYKVRHPQIIGLYNQVMHLLAGFKEFSINNIPRQQNHDADRLASHAALAATAPQKKSAAKIAPEDNKQLALF